MWLDYSLDGKVQVQMYDYIDNMLAALPEDMRGTVASPAADHLFTVNDAGKKLTREQAEMFHHNVAKLLFFMQTGLSGYSNCCSISDNPCDGT